MNIISLLTLDTLWTVMVLTGMVLTAFMYSVKSRRLFLLYNALAIALYIPEAVFKELFSGAIIFALIAIMSVMQACANEEDDADKTLKYRILVAVIGICLGLPFVIQKSTDILPILAFAFGRIAEAQSSTIRICCWYIIVSVAWLGYFAAESNWLFFFVSSSGLFFNILFNHQDFKQLLSYLKTKAFRLFRS